MKMKIFATLLLMLSITCAAQFHHQHHKDNTPKKNEKVYGNAAVQRVHSIYDADTFRVDISGWPDIVGKNIPVRADGFDAPEIIGKCPKEKEEARQARQLTVDFLQKGDEIELRNIRRGKYFRLIANVYVDGRSLTDMQLASGISRPYSGGKRKGWCKGNKRKY